MGMQVRSEISRKKLYWLPKHRYLELMHFCLQYPEWKAELTTLDGYSSGAALAERMPDNSGRIAKPVERIVEQRLELEEKVDMVDRAVMEAALDLHRYLLRGVTQGVGYDALDIPCCKDVYYQMYRKFFWLLDKARK